MTENTVATENAASRQAHYLHAILTLIVVIAVVTWAATSGYSRWSVSKHIFDHEKEVRAGKNLDESTLVLITSNDAAGVRAAYYKLGNGAYAKALRLAGIGCRFYSPKGMIYSFKKYKPVDPIPYDAIEDGSIVKGQCNASELDDFDLARAQK